MNLKQMREQSKTLHKMLDPKNDYKMTEAIRYLRDKDLSQDQLESMRLDLLEKAMTAQKAGKPAESAFGYNYKNYIDEQVARLAPMSQATSRYETFRLWGLLILALPAISIAQNLAVSLLTDAPLRWQVRAFELLFFLLIAGLSVILASLFSRFKLERDPDFFTKKEGNRFNAFFKTYGLSLLWMLICFGLMFILKDRLLWDLPLPAGVLLLALLVVGYLLVTNLLRRSARNA